MTVPGKPYTLCGLVTLLGIVRVELILVRHGLPLRVEQEQGRADPALSEAGHRQARQVGDWLARERIDAIYTSPMRRAVETAAPLAQRRTMQPIIRDDLAEYDRAASHYIPMEQLKAEDYAAWKAFVDGGYGDDFDIEVFRRRVAAGMEAIIGAHRGKRVAVFCHGGVVNVWACTVLDMPPRLFIDVRYASISRFLCAATGERNLKSLNEIQHLTEPDARSLHAESFPGR